ncbi:MAG: VCBS repeat-containing protein [Lentisphaerae bacterium]|nr:VCBS repeat-containing protein [Lentisphaerota bacterium]
MKKSINNRNASVSRERRLQASLLSFPRKRESSISIEDFWIPDQVGNDKKIFSTHITHRLPLAPRLTLALTALLALSGLSPAQTNAPAPTGKPGNLLSATFRGEQVVPNYWDGVASNNDLCVHGAALPVLDNVGHMVSTPMSTCPNFVDMNGDNLKDLVVSDPQGYLWIYLNSGEKGKPKFTTGEFLPTFLGGSAKIHVCDWDGDMDNDVLFGTFYGDVGVLENIGTRMQPKFIRRMGIPRYISTEYGVEDPRDRVLTLMLGKQVMLLGNYMAPWVADWNNDGKPDLIMGEGTYSANSVRLLLNTGSRNKPVFIEDRVFFLAYGEGFEQLTPAVTDYNGDGLSDLIVGTRTGQIRLHKGTKKAVEGKDMVAAIRGTLAPAILEYDHNVKLGDKEVINGMSFAYPCDWNEDGLIDLLLGSPNGKVLIALNEGSKTEPKFPKAEPVKGTDTEKDLVAPASWQHNGFGVGYCNSAVMMSAEKEVALRAGYPIRPVEGEYFMYFRYIKHYPGFVVSQQGPVVGARAMYGPSVTLKIRHEYEFTFSAILEGKPATWRLSGRELIEEETEEHPEVHADRHISDQVQPSGGWQKRTYRFACPQTVQSNLTYGLYFQMPEGEAQFMLDDLSLKMVR